MRAERRWNLRKPVTADVVIDNQPIGLMRGRITNVSVGGLYVHTGPLTPAPQAHVELVLLRQAESGTRVFRIPTMVVRTANQGVGLVIHQYDLDSFRTLVALLLDPNFPPPEAAPTASVPDANTNPADDRQRLDPGLAGTAGTAEVAVARIVPLSQNASPHPGDF